MAVRTVDPLRQFEHSHAVLTKHASELRTLVHAESAEGSATSSLRIQLASGLECLRDELIQHFANEEEGLFPFVQQNVATSAEMVERLADAHDSICGTIVRLVHLVQHDKNALGPDRSLLVAHYDRFENAYARHSQQEAALFETLGRTLDEPHRAQLSEILRGL